MQQATDRNKWDRLGVELKNYMKSNLNSYNQFTRPVSQLLKEFSDMHQETTYGSTVYYYYNNVKMELEDEVRNGNLIPQNPNNRPLVIEEEPQPTDEEIEIIKELDAKVNEVKNMIGYIEGRTGYTVSDDSREVIEEMIDNHGVVETLVSIFDSIENVENIDMFNVIVKEARNKINPSH